MRVSALTRVENAHDDAVWGVSWTPESAGSLLATGSVDESVKIWAENKPNGTLEQVHQLLGLELGVLSVAHDDAGRYGAASSMDAVVNVWNLDGFSAAARFERPPAETWSLAFAPGVAAGAPAVLAIAGGASNAVALLQVAPGDAPGSQGAGAADEAAAAAAAAGVPSASGGGDAEAPHSSLLRLPRPEGRGAGSQDFVLSVAWSPDGRRLAAGAMDGTVAIFDAERRELLGTLPGHARPVRSLVFTPDGRHVLTACDDQHARIFDAHSRELVAAISEHAAWVTSVDVHPSGATFATGSTDSHVRVFDIASRTLVQTLSSHEDQVWGVSFSPDGARLATVSDDASICLYSVQS